jgi:hypothetical protein
LGGLLISRKARSKPHIFHDGQVSLASTKPGCCLTAFGQHFEVKGNLKSQLNIRPCKIR